MIPTAIAQPEHETDEMAWHRSETVEGVADDHSWLDVHDPWCPLCTSDPRADLEDRYRVGMAQALSAIVGAESVTA